jgi:ribosomal-protein-alanine N-acetyltransferase
MKALRQLFTPSKPPGLPAAEPVFGRVALRLPAFEDFGAWAELRETSRAFLEPWEPVWSPSELTRSGFRERVRKVHQAFESDTGYHFLVFRREDNCMLGGINLSHIRRGVAQMGTIGYWVGQSFARQGYMTEALSAITTYAFSDLALHRLEAACIPTNLASVNLLKRCQFVHEGEAKNYLKIAGKWQDHLLFSRTAS